MDGSESRLGVFEQHYGAVRRFFRNKVPADVRHDLVQATFLAYFKAPDRFAGRSTLRAYLLGIAHIVLMDHLRRQQRSMGRECEWDVEELVLADVMPGPDDVAHRRREDRLLLKALRHLRVVHQVVIELQYWESFSNQQIADALGWPIGTVKTRLRAAHRDLSAQIAALADSEEAQRSTIDSLERWAERTRWRARPAPGPDHHEDI